MLEVQEKEIQVFEMWCDKSWIGFSDVPVHKVIIHTSDT